MCDEKKKRKDKRRRRLRRGERQIEVQGG